MRREAIAVARRVGDSFAEVNARINLVTQLATRGVLLIWTKSSVVVEPSKGASTRRHTARSSTSSGLRVGTYRSTASSWSSRRVAAGSPRFPHRIDRAVPRGVGRHVSPRPVRSVDRGGHGAPAGRRPCAGRVYTPCSFGGRRGPRVSARDARASTELLGTLRPLALASGELQRIIPMAAVVLPWLARAGEREELRSLTNEILALADRQWPAVLEAVPIARALAAAGEKDLLERTTESIRGTRTLRGMPRQR